MFSIHTLHKKTLFYIFIWQLFGFFIEINPKSIAMWDNLKIYLSGNPVASYYNLVSHVLATVSFFRPWVSFHKFCAGGSVPASKFVIRKLWLFQAVPVVVLVRLKSTHTAFNSLKQQICI